MIFEVFRLFHSPPGQKVYWDPYVVQLSRPAQQRDCCLRQLSFSVMMICDTPSRHTRYISGVNPDRPQFAFHFSSSCKPCSSFCKNTVNRVN